MRLNAARFVLLKTCIVFLPYGSSKGTLLLESPPFHLERSDGCANCFVLIGVMPWPQPRETLNRNPCFYRFLADNFFYLPQGSLLLKAISVLREDLADFKVLVLTHLRRDFLPRLKHLDCGDGRANVVDAKLTSPLVSWVSIGDQNKMQWTKIVNRLQWFWIWEITCIIYKMWDASK